LIEIKSEISPQSSRKSYASPRGFLNNRSLSHGTPVAIIKHMHQLGFSFGVVLLVAALVGVTSALVPSYRASHVNIVEGLRHIG